MSVVARHHLDLADARTLPTTALALTTRAVHDLVQARAMGVVHGPAGCGKTFAWQTAAGRLDVAVCAVQFPSRPSMLRVAQVLFGRLTGQPPTGNRFWLGDQLIDLLAETPRLIVIDEAQWLTRESIEYLRHLHDDPATRFGLLLAGGDGCWQVLAREPMLRSRLHRRVIFAPLDRDAVLRAIPSYHPIYSAADPALIAQIDEHFAKGNLRAWAEFTHTANDLCKSSASECVNAEIAGTVLALHGQSPIAA